MIKQADIIAYAWSQSEFTRREMMDYFRKQNLDFSKSTIASCLEALIHSGILKKIKRGVYSISEAKVKPFVPYYDKNMLDLESLIRSEFQFIRFCVWSCSDMKRYSHYVVNMDVIYVDKAITASDLISVKTNRGTCFIANTPGEAPYLLRCDITTDWPAENQRIENKYPNFTFYVNENRAPFWWGDTDNYPDITPKTQANTLGDIDALAALRDKLGSRRGN